MIKAIIFDWDGVFTSDFYKEISKVCNDKKRILKFEHKYTDINNCDGFWQDLRKEFNIKNSDEDLKKRFLYHNKTGLLELLPKLKKYKLYLLSNQIKVRADYIKSNFDLSSFKKTFFSNEIGLMKPNKEIFEFALNKIKLKPEECLFIDDRYNNILTAKKLGINTIQCKNLTQLKKDILSFSIQLD